MKNFKSHFKFNKQERSGIFFLLLIIILIQVGYYLVQRFSVNNTTSFYLDSELQGKIDSLKQEALQRDSITIYPFNPNFISDYKGYTLGMSTIEIDRLHHFRKQNKYVNSSKEFQNVTLISDSLLKHIAPYFKFPDWVNANKKTKTPPTSSSNLSRDGISKKEGYKDLNTATIEDLKQVNGIGEKLSARIIKFRDRLGGFLVAEQLYDVYGLKEEVVKRALNRFKVLNTPKIKKININTASVEMLTKLIYLQEDVAIDLVNYRNSKGTIDSFEELINIENFPAKKIERIALYLSLKE